MGISGCFVLRHKSKIVLFIGILVVFSAWVGFYPAQQDSKGLPDSSGNKAEPKPVASLNPTQNNTSLNKQQSPIQASTITKGEPKVLTGNPHYDQLSPEMQKALKDSLLLEGPRETYTRADGSVVLPSNGRFTQMPVAVQMPDGTIKIQEYSNIPKPQIKLNTPK